MQLLDRIGSSTVGREDRIVRACVAFSLILMAVFAILSSGGLGILSSLFLIAGLFFAVTAGTGRDPLYARLGLDTRPAAVPPGDPGDAGGQRPSFLDLREARTAGHESG